MSSDEFDPVENFNREWDIGLDHSFPVKDFAGIPWPPKEWNEKNEKISRSMMKGSKK